MNKAFSIGSLCAHALFLFGLIDLVRGAVHTFFIRTLALNASGIDPHPDALVIMSAFGMSNFVTGGLFILVALKARPLAPPVLLNLSLGYIIGGIGMRHSDVVMLSQFNGQYLMIPYLTLSLLLSLSYFAIRAFKQNPSRQC